MRGETVVGLSDVGARCAASGLWSGGEQPEKGDTAGATAEKAEVRTMKKEQTSSLRSPGHPGSPRYWGVSFLTSFFIPRETGNLFLINVAEGGVAMESVAVGTGLALSRIRAVEDSCWSCHLGRGLRVERALWEEIMTCR